MPNEDFDFFPDAKKIADGFVADVQGRFDKNAFIFNRRYHAFSRANNEQR
jgi:hypothetical protein